TSELAAQSILTLTRPGGSQKRIRFDDLSPLPPEAAAVRSALEGLKLILLAPLAPASRFTADRIPPGTLLKRFDGAVFRVRQLLRRPRSRFSRSLPSRARRKGRRDPAREPRAAPSPARGSRDPGSLGGKRPAGPRPGRGTIRHCFCRPAIRRAGGGPSRARRR